ncbi:TIGR03759 family integrating conjugative element protein [Proteus vulgaris]|jgi:integrating conjugative element protein (TIGR03759 family)|uniref:Integrating conjugative element protein, PFL_4693 family n=3 Tax=Enterobacterales TaxID=91347 RepID=A0A379F642_PROVU|nr:TIGR03759 family integrating conjugative element protein [Proteus vulgaris]NBN61168.1 TIGR03759 family integrating conjugative element protein [Proteus sp. G2639]AYY79729.1 TIGR03759 family integrating conjugative element protein [Proteus vulgaris]MBW3471367.1 TIGR03759 family integrating conjugative element protein [Proteus vulgaris]MCH4257309.1 TIGR03759 family integrating conjugative element protein [Proteus vulgaris]MDM3565179.1 TIGR03759 family integrating conjugative element protein [
MKMQSILYSQFLVLLGISVLTVSTEGMATQNQHQVLKTEQQALEQSLITENAQEWKLTEKEWQRYEMLKKGKRGLFSPNLDPLTLLGIEARTYEERRYFAELVVRQEFQRVEAELAFQREVNQAWLRLYPEILPIQHEIRENRQALFVKENCPVCDVKLTQLIKQNQPIDIYLVGSTGKDDVIRHWAKKHHIPIEKIRNRHITLNHDNGIWLKHGNGMMPVVLQQGVQGWQRAD